MLDDYKDRVAVVSGGAEGIGRALVAAFAVQGMRTAVLDVDEPAAQRTAEETGAAAAIACDVTDREAVADAAERARALGPIGVVWANAGVGTLGGPLAMAQGDLDWIYGVNVAGMLNVLRAFKSDILEGEGPRHVGITASVSGFTPPAPYAATYGASKFATIGIAEAVRAELAETDVDVTVLCPGLVNTRIWNAVSRRPERFGGPGAMPEEVGDRWRENGMSPDWIAKEALACMARGGGYCSPTDPHSRDDFEERAGAIRDSFVHPGD